MKCLQKKTAFSQLCNFVEYVLSELCTVRFNFVCHCSVKECCVIDFNLLQSRPAKIHDWIKPWIIVVCGKWVLDDKSIYNKHTHTVCHSFSLEVEDHIPPNLWKKLSGHNFHRLLQCMACVRERETVGVVYECVSELWNALPASLGTVTA